MSLKCGFALAIACSAEIWTMITTANLWYAN